MLLNIFIFLKLKKSILANLGYTHIFIGVIVYLLIIASY